MFVGGVFGTGMISKNLWKDIQLNGYLSNFTFQRIEVTSTEVL